MVLVVKGLVNGCRRIRIIIPAYISIRNTLVLVKKSIGRKIEFVLADIKIQSGIDGTVAVNTTADVPVITGFTVFLKDDIDDTGTATGGIVFGRGIGNHFHAFDGIGRNLVQRKRGGPAVYI